jgi:hypothetical protein
VSQSRKNWHAVLRERLPLYGHRNWIVIADSAYPAQSSAGIETLVTGAAQLSVVRTVLKEISRRKHVRPIVHSDSELKQVTEADAPGVGAYRGALDGLLKGNNVLTLPHEQIIVKLDEAARLFNVLILKSTMTIPYTSIFVQLDCGYWSESAEKRLRKSLG